ncbi:hypothetical protein [Rubrivirga sp.]|uniref:hypothetical protein n=1 Tax=Rubrivirga sp. TaxID=1885344 RepID=UPI003C78BD46
MSQSFESPAWQMIGATQTKPGYLTLHDGVLTFEVEGEKVFGVHLHQVEDVVFPWYYFSGGVKLRVKKNDYRISFTKPNGAMDPDDRSAGLESVKSIGSGRKAGKAWKEVLT